MNQEDLTFVVLPDVIAKAVGDPLEKPCGRRKGADKVLKYADLVWIAELSRHRDMMFRSGHVGIFNRIVPEVFKEKMLDSDSNGTRFCIWVWRELHSSVIYGGPSTGSSSLTDSYPSPFQLLRSVGGQVGYAVERGTGAPSRRWVKPIADGDELPSTAPVVMAKVSLSCHHEAAIMSSFGDIESLVRNIKCIPKSGGSEVEQTAGEDTDLVKVATDRMKELQKRYPAPEFQTKKYDDSDVHALDTDRVTSMLKDLMECRDVALGFSDEYNHISSGPVSSIDGKVDGLPDDRRGRVVKDTFPQDNLESLVGRQTETHTATSSSITFTPTDSYGGDGHPIGRFTPWSSLSSYSDFVDQYGQNWDPQNIIGSRLAFKWGHMYTRLVDSYYFSFPSTGGYYLTGKGSVKVDIPLANRVRYSSRDHTYGDDANTYREVNYEFIQSNGKWTAEYAVDHTPADKIEISTYANAGPNRLVRYMVFPRDVEIESMDVVLRIVFCKSESADIPVRSFMVGLQTENESSKFTHSSRGFVQTHSGSFTDPEAVQGYDQAAYPMLEIQPWEYTRSVAVVLVPIRVLKEDIVTESVNLSYTDYNEHTWTMEANIVSSFKLKAGDLMEKVKSAAEEAESDCSWKVTEPADAEPSVANNLDNPQLSIEEMSRGTVTLGELTMLEIDSGLVDSIVVRNKINKATIEDGKGNGGEP